jgi:hypothetical protein
MASDGKFQKGKPGGPGRPKGGRNRLSEALLSMLAKDFEEFGEEAIRTVRRDHPETYLRVAASLVPKELVVADKTHEEALRELAQDDT